MLHTRNIETEQSKRDARWNAARTFSDCDAYMAIEAQNAARRAGAHIEANAWKGRNFVLAATTARANRYLDARIALGITEADQLYS